MDFPRRDTLADIIPGSESRIKEEMEISEVVSLFNELNGRDVLELCANVGAYTGELAEQGANVVAVDSNLSCVHKNKDANGHLPNVEFIHSDVMACEFPQKSFDLVLSNWLFTSRDNEKIRVLIEKILGWLRVGGQFFFRETCGQNTGCSSPSPMMTKKYRASSIYNSLLYSSAIETENGEGCYGFDVILSKSIQTYANENSGSEQVCWLVEKTERDESANHGFQTRQEYLDFVLYSQRHIQQAELLLGENSTSVLSHSVAQEVLDSIRMAEGHHMLDLGCGLGSISLAATLKYKIDVTAVDLSTNMITLARERLEESCSLNKGIEFEVSDITKRDFPDRYFDVIIIIDSLIHVENKANLIEKCFRWLKSEGSLIIVDMFLKETTHQLEDWMKKACKTNLWFLTSQKEMFQTLESASFNVLTKHDVTSQIFSSAKDIKARLLNPDAPLLRGCTKLEIKSLIEAFEFKERLTNNQAYQFLLLHLKKPKISNFSL